MADELPLRQMLATIPGHYAQPPAEMVAKLPKGKRDDNVQKVNCAVCGTYHQRNFVHLDFVGHGDITLMLIDADPQWSWEPMAYADDGGPMIRKSGNTLELWGWLTLLGNRKPGVGTCEAGKADASKELIGDFLRNAAMRFGFATKLWSKTAGMPDTGDHEQVADGAPTEYPPVPATWVDGVLNKAGEVGIPQATIKRFVRAATKHRTDDIYEVRQGEEGDALKASLTAEANKLTADPVQTPAGEA